MKCFYHPEEETVASCVECGKGLCKTCAGIWQPATCDKCAENKIAAERRELYRPLGLGLIIFLAWMVFITVFCAANQDFSGYFEGILPGLIYAGIPSGWRVVNRINFPIVVGSFIVIIALYGVKILLSMAVGLVAAPVNIVKYVLREKTLKEYERQINERRANLYSFDLKYEEGNLTEAEQDFTSAV